MRNNLERNSRGDGGFIVAKAARGRDTRSGGTPRRFDSDKMSALYDIAVSLWAKFKCDCANHRLNINGEERYRRTQVGPVEDKIGSTRLTRLRAASP
jgi:hypothetical protein